MGIPTFFLNILKDKTKTNVHSGIKAGNVACDYFFMDYNGILYASYYKIKKDILGKKLIKSKVEEMIINETIRYTKYIITEVVQPKKLTYIALDGPAPRAKMVQQRSRRYKSIQLKNALKEGRKKFNMEEDLSEWDASSNICPGSEFMNKLSLKLIEVMKHKGFSTHNSNMKTIFSDSSVPGEGEHKFLNDIKKMRDQKSTKNASVYLYGKDADLIVLAVTTHKSNIHVMREVQKDMPVMKEMYENFEFIDLNIDNLRDCFNNDLTRTFKHNDPLQDKICILNDYILLTFLVGNDFVMSLSYLKMSKNGLETIIARYHNLKPKFDNYLVIYDIHKDTPPRINVPFFTELIREISKIEDTQMKEKQQQINKYMGGYKDFRMMEDEKNLTKYELFESRYQHLYMFSPYNPLYEEYHKEFKKINYLQNYEKWKEEYYKYYLNTSSNTDSNEYLEMRMKLVENYLESIMFNLKYYFQGCPSWTWHYKFRTAPLLSDVLYALEKVEQVEQMNNIEFTLGEPYTPFQQLMLILPPQMDKLMPTVLRPIMTDDKLLCTQFYPESFKIDSTVGLKQIYCEAILPEIDEDILLPIVKKMEEKLNEKDKERNTIKLLPLKFV